MATVSQRSFASGELGIALRYRVDLAKYGTGLSRCRNFIIPRSGGTENRQGSQFVGQIKDFNSPVRLIPFILSQSESYMLELGNQYMRIVFQDRYLNFGTDVGTAPPPAITAISQASPGVVTATAHGFTTLDEIVISGVVGMTDLNGRNFRVTNLTTNTFTLLDAYTGQPVNTTSYNAYISGGTISRIFYLVTPYITADLPYLKYAQNATSLTITMDNYVPREVTLGSIGPYFAINQSSFITPDVGEVTALANSGGAGTPSDNTYKVTSLGADGEESVGVDTYTTTVASSGTPVALTWTDNSKAYAYNIYRRLSTEVNFKLIGNVPYGSRLSDNGIAGTAALRSRNPIFFPQTDGFTNNPGAVGYFQQRKFYGETKGNPEGGWASWTGHYSDFFLPVPVTDAAPLSFSMAGNQVNTIEHYLGLGKLFILCQSGEYLCDGDANGVITPTGGINVRPLSYYGSSYIRPIVVGDNFLFVQSRQSIIRDFTNEYTDTNFKGNDLTLFSTHLFDGYQIMDWAYQQIPNSIVWVVRSDGTALSLTYIKEHQILGWATHDFSGGFVENVACLPSSTGDIPYFVVRRTINGAVRRYIERIPPKTIVDVRDCIYMDAALSYDGRNTGSTTLAMSGGALYTDTVTLTASVSIFTTADIGHEFQITGTDGTLIRFSVTAYVSGTVVTGNPNKSIPFSMQGATLTTWTKAIKTFGGLFHLEGQLVSVLGDGFVVASPNNPGVTQLTVLNGQVTLDRPYGIVHIGLPYTSDLETLDVDTAQSETLADKNKLVTQVDVFLANSRGGFFGNRPAGTVDGSSLDKMVEIKVRNAEPYDSPVSLVTGKLKVNIAPNWNSNGRVLIRQVDPLPLNILGVAGAGNLPFRGN